MEIKILDRILHGPLRPWKFDLKNTRHLSEVIKAAKSIIPDTHEKQAAYLSELLQDYPVLQKELTRAVHQDNFIKPLCYQSNLPDYIDISTQYYNLLINAETLRVFNFIIQQSAEWKEPVDVIYHVSRTLTNIKVLAKQTVEELLERGFTTIPNAQSDVVHFALYFLKANLIALYFSIQEEFASILVQKTTLEDFYLHDLQERTSDIIELKYIQPATIKPHQVIKKIERFSFAYKGNSVALKAVLIQLAEKVDLVNDSLNTIDELFQLLVSKDIQPGATIINIGCETVEFRHILDELNPYFEKFTFANVEKSKSFKSKKGTLYTAQNLYSSKVNKTKRTEEIDSIIKCLKKEH